MGKLNKNKILNILLLIVLTFSFMPINEIADEVQIPQDEFVDFNNDSNEDEVNEEQENVKEEVDEKPSTEQDSVVDDVEEVQEEPSTTTKQEESSSVEETKAEEKTATEFGMDLSEWNYSFSSNKVVLNSYIGSATENDVLIVPGKLDGKEVLIKNAFNFGTKAGIVFKEVEGVKVNLEWGSSQTGMFRNLVVNGDLDLTGLDLNQLSNCTNFFNGLTAQRLILGDNTFPRVNNASKMFGYSNIQEIVGIENLNIETIFYDSLFEGAQINDKDMVELLPVVGKTRLVYMFENAVFNVSVDISGWDVSEVQLARHMFYKVDLKGNKITFNGANWAKMQDVRLIFDTVKNGTIEANDWTWTSNAI